MMTTKDCFLTKNKYSRPGVLLKGVRGIIVHWVANPGTQAMANRNYFEHLKDQQPGQLPHKYRYASAHYIIGIDGEVIRCVPNTEVCYHVGADRYTNEAFCRLSSYPNNCTIGIELCHPKADGKFSEATLQSCRELLSSLLLQYDLSKEAIWRHFDVTGKACPKYFVEHADEWTAFKASIHKLAA
jgi:N-acetylmuramoyl-L-alanine amidase